MTRYVILNNFNIKTYDTELLRLPAKLDDYNNMVINYNN